MRWVKFIIEGKSKGKIVEEVSVQNLDTLGKRKNE